MQDSVPQGLIPHLSLNGPPNRPDVLHEKENHEKKQERKRKDKREKFDRSSNRRKVIPSRSRVPETTIPTLRSLFTPEIAKSYLIIVRSSIRGRERIFR